MAELLRGMMLMAALAAMGVGLAPPASAQVPVSQAPVSQAILGEWFTPKHDGVVRIAPCGGAICGRLVGMDYAGPMPRDYAGRPQCQYPLMNDFRPGDDGELAGTIVNPDDGKTYKATLRAGEGDTVKLRGYVLVPLFGSTQTWTRFTGRTGPDCHILPR